MIKRKGVHDTIEYNISYINQSTSNFATKFTGNFTVWILKIVGEIHNQPDSQETGLAQLAQQNKE